MFLVEAFVSRLEVYQAGIMTYALLALHLVEQ
jgi:hypothetical protein